MKDEPGLTSEPEYTSILLGLGEDGLELKEEPGLTPEPEYTNILLDSVIQGFNHEQGSGKNVYNLGV